MSGSPSWHSMKDNYMYHPVHVIIENVNDCRKEMHNNAWYFRKGYRKMVKSPEPVDILEKDTIRNHDFKRLCPHGSWG
ncbi:hypothetical protein [Acidiplasma sp.]|uniref:hypothetical protein n=1 Tax=Acidiplasma sp. TaxID=1872114 RepID=UPI0031675B7A